MGCECPNPIEKLEELNSSQNIDKIKAKESINNNSKLQYNPDNITIDPNGKPKDEFSRYVFDQINSLRQDPQSYIEYISKAKTNVILDKSGIKIYKSSVKVALNTGESAFDTAITILKNTEPMPKLIYSPYLTIDVPNNEIELKSKDYLSGQIKKKIDCGTHIKSFWRDIISDADTCFILTVVDDCGNNPGNKRNDILNRNNKYIGISSAKIGKSFACYIIIA